MPPRRAPTADQKGKGKATSSTTPAPSSTAPPQPSASPAPAAEPSLFLGAGDDDDETLSDIDEAVAAAHLFDPTSDSSDAENSDSDDDDPVVMTYDIHLTSTLAPHLHLLQYPVRGKHQPYSKLTNTCPLTARLKPHSGTLEVDVPINTARYYDQEKGRRWGEAMHKAAIAREAKIRGANASTVRSGGKRRKAADDDDDADDSPPTPQSFEEAKAQGRIMAKQTLSAKILPESTRYMIGVFRQPPAPQPSQPPPPSSETEPQAADETPSTSTSTPLQPQTQDKNLDDPLDASSKSAPPPPPSSTPATKPTTTPIKRNPQLHLTPLHAVLQLRPQFKYVDTAADLERALARSSRYDPPDPALAPTARSIQATVKNSIDGDASAGQPESALQTLRREEGEEWRNLEWVDQDDEEAWNMFENMFLPGTEEDVVGGVVGVKEEGGSASAGACGSGVPRLRTEMTPGEYLQLLAAPRTEKDD